MFSGGRGPPTPAIRYAPAVFCASSSIVICGVLLEEFAKDAEGSAKQTAGGLFAGNVVRSRCNRATSARPRVAHDRRQHLVDLVIQQRRHFEELASALRAHLLALCEVPRTQ